MCEMLKRMEQFQCQLRYSEHIQCKEGEAKTLPLVLQKAASWELLQTLTFKKQQKVATRLSWLATKLHSMPTAIIHPEEKTTPKDHPGQWGSTCYRHLLIKSLTTQVPKHIIKVSLESIHKFYVSYENILINICETGESFLQKNRKPSKLLYSQEVNFYVKKFHGDIQNMPKDPNW